MMKGQERVPVSDTDSRPGHPHKLFPLPFGIFQLEDPHRHEKSQEACNFKACLAYKLTEPLSQNK